MSKKLGLLVALCSFSAYAAPLKIALVAPLTGDQSAYGIVMRQGAQIALSSQSAAFKNLGYELVLQPFDDQANASVATKFVADIAADSSILGVIGAYNSSVSNVLGQQLSSGSMPVISPGSTNDKLTQNGWQTFQRVVAPDGSQGGAAASFIVGNLKAGKVAVISDNTTYGNGLTKITEASLKKAGVTVSYSSGASTSEQIDGVVKAIKGANVDAVYFGGNYDVGAELLNKLRAAKVNAKFVGADGLDTRDFIKRAGKNAVGVYHSTVFGVDNNLDSVKYFNKVYAAQYKSQPDRLAAFSYDATNLLLSSIRKLLEERKSLPSRKQIADAVRQTNLPACNNSVACANITGPISFTDTGERDLAKIYIMRIDDQSVPEVVQVKTVNQN